MFQIEIDNKNVGQQEENSWFDEELTKKRRKKRVHKRRMISFDMFDELERELNEIQDDEWNDKYEIVLFFMFNLKIIKTMLTIVP